MEVILRKLEEKLQEEEREKPEVEQKTQYAYFKHRALLKIC